MMSTVDQPATVLLLAEPPDAELGTVLLRDAIVALTRAVLVRKGALIVPSHPVTACLAGLVAAESFEPPALESGEVRGPAPVTVVPWPGEPDEGMLELLTGWQTHGLVEHMRSEPGDWRGVLAEVIDRRAPRAVVAMGGGRSVGEAMTLVENLRSAPRFLYTLEIVGGVAAERMRPWYQLAQAERSRLEGFRPTFDGRDPNEITDTPGADAMSALVGEAADAILASLAMESVAEGSLPQRPDTDTPR